MKFRHLAALAGVLGFSAYHLFYRRPLPRTGGLLHFPELDAELEITRDARGIPHIRAQSWADAWRAIGWVHAQDRPFQLDLQRRVPQGRLSELFGKRTLKADRFLRRLDLTRAAQAEWEHASPEEKTMLQAYAEGVNRVWQGHRRASEFALLNYRPEAWLPYHSYLWVKAMAHDMACNWEYELLRTLIQRAGLSPDKLSRCSLSPWAEMPITGGGLTSDTLELLLAEYAAVKECLPDGFFPTEPLAGSNAWAVSGERSRDGFPLLANDPHLAMKVPDYWYELRLQVEGQSLFGAGMPGIPGVVLGQNSSLAWGVTNSYIDVQDLFAEEINWESRQVRGPVGAEPLVSRQEQIQVRLAQPVSVTYYETPRGPLLWGGPEQGNSGLSLAWSGRQPGGFFKALAGLNRASSVAEAREALRDWHLPVLNFVLADRQNIAHQVAGRIPKRRPGSGLVVAPAWEAGWRWQVELPFEELPHQINPECGYVVSANHSVSSRAGHFLSWDFNPGFRAERIEHLLVSQNKHDLESFAAIQLDQTSSLAQRLLRQVPNLRANSACQSSALAILSDWDAHLHPNSAGACIYQSWLARIGELALGELLPDSLTPWLLGERGFNPLDPRPSHTTRFQGRVAQACLTRETGWLVDDNWDRLLQQAFQEAVERLQQRFGDDPQRWGWGKLHGLRLEHPLAKLAGLFPSLGPFPCGGDAESPNQTGTRIENGLPGQVSIGASWRYLVRLSDLHCRSAHCPGQSGHPGSPHYKDGLQPWLKGAYHHPLEAPVLKTLKLSPTRPQKGDP